MTYRRLQHGSWIGRLRDERGLLNTEMARGLETQPFEYGYGAKVQDEAMELRFEGEVPPERHRIGKFQGHLMVGAAGLFDALQMLFAWTIILLPLAWLVTIVAWLTFFVWFKCLTPPVNFFDGGTRKIAAWTVSYLADVLSIGVLPVIALGTYVMILIVRAEDAVYNKSRGNIELNIDEQFRHFNAS